jgi:threonine/homoserine/homoserine lactone efflux protein
MADNANPAARMQMPEFIAAILVLLATPGPTNTLLSLAAFWRGTLRAAPLLGAEAAGYLTVVVPIATLAAPFFASYPAALPALKLGAALWVLVLAARLWRNAHSNSAAGAVTAAQVYATTVLNPKAPVIALVIMPHGPLFQILPWLALFAMLTVTAGACWITAGGLLKRSPGGLAKEWLVRRTAAVCLVGFSLALSGSGIGALA